MEVKKYVFEEEEIKQHTLFTIYIKYLINTRGFTF